MKKALHGVADRYIFYKIIAIPAAAKLFKPDTPVQARAKLDFITADPNNFEGDNFVMDIVNNSAKAGIGIGIGSSVILYSTSAVGRQLTNNVVGMASGLGASGLAGNIALGLAFPFVGAFIGPFLGVAVGGLIAKIANWSTGKNKAKIPLKNQPVVKWTPPPPKIAGIFGALSGMLSGAFKGYFLTAPILGPFGILGGIAAGIIGFGVVGFLGGYLSAVVMKKLTKLFRKEPQLTINKDQLPPSIASNAEIIKKLFKYQDNINAKYLILKNDYSESMQWINANILDLKDRQVLLKLVHNANQAAQKTLKK